MDEETALWGQIFQSKRTEAEKGHPFLVACAYFAGVSLCYKKGFPSEDGISPASFPVYHFNITRFPDGPLPTPFI